MIKLYRNRECESRVSFFAMKQPRGNVHIADLSPYEVFYARATLIQFREDALKDIAADLHVEWSQVEACLYKSKHSQQLARADAVLRALRCASDLTVSQVVTAMREHSGILAISGILCPGFKVRESGEPISDMSHPFLKTKLRDLSPAHTKHLIDNIHSVGALSVFSFFEIGLSVDFQACTRECSPDQRSRISAALDANGDKTLADLQLAAARVGLEEWAGCIDGVWMTKHVTA